MRHIKKIKYVLFSNFKSVLRDKCRIIKSNPVILGNMTEGNGYFCAMSKPILSFQNKIFQIKKKENRAKSVQQVTTEAKQKTFKHYTVEGSVAQSSEHIGLSCLMSRAPSSACL